MRAIIDDEGGKAMAPRTLRQNRHAKLESRVGKTALCVHPHDGGSFLRHQFRHGVRLDLASLHGAQGAFDAVNAMRFAMVALARNDHACNSARLNGVQSRLAENLFHARMEFFNREVGAVRHFPSFITVSTRAAF
ncbi:hypothetical protein DK65_2235 [Brucella pinnipedialis]|nr:hypothetical protein DK65_2235 [Brucella pinnipedialis]ENR12694.1 hypothetical protein C066_02448 [Brucella sp. UK5/01]ENT13658.1 hypothetical protein C067_02407 [Brucella sp. F8/99]ENT20995.1 hypothetical protein C051_02405 [Brucella sp. UK40/99]